MNHKGSIWNPSNCGCECDKSCDVGEHLDYKNCKCKKKLVDKLVECSSTVVECTENIDEVKITEITSMEFHSIKLQLAMHENLCICSYTICVVLAVIALAMSIGIGVYFSYSCWYLKKDVTHIKLVLVLNGIALEQQFNESNSIKLINGKSKTNRDQKSNLLFLQ